VDAGRGGVVSPVVHQIRYRRSEASLLGGRGMGPVESTMPAGSLATWDAFLRDHVWAAGPEPGFTYVAHNGVGALIRKVTAAGSSAHAVLSRALSARAALGLTTWTGWDRAGLEALRWPSLEPAVTQGLLGVRDRAMGLPAGRLAALFAQLLGTAGEPYTVLGEDDPVAVVLAFGDLFGHTPAFATDEADDHGAHLPIAVFLRQAPVSTTVAARRRLVAGGPSPDPGLLAFTTTVAGAYVTEGPDALTRIRPARPPADLAEARAWARSAQFAPGVLADVTRLPRLSPELAERLDDAAVQRVVTAAKAAPAVDLAHALDRGLPPAVAGPVFRVALARALSADQARPAGVGSADRARPAGVGSADRARSAGVGSADRARSAGVGSADHARPAAAGEHVLLDRLAELGPLAPQMLAEHLPLDLDRLAYVSGRLLTAEDRAAVLTEAAAALPVPELLAWIEKQAADDPSAAVAGYAALCRRGPELSGADVAAVVERQALAGCVRQITGTPREAARQVAALLGALPAGVLSMDVAARLTAGGDPLLLHALDTVVTDAAVREALHWQIRVAYYRSHQLPEPVPPAGEAPAESGPWWQRAKPRRRP
jgi:hypothetical protein